MTAPPPSYPPVQHYNHNAHSTVDPQASKTTRAANDQSQLPVLPASPSRNANKNIHIGSPSNTPSRSELLLNGSPHTVDLPATGHEMRITSPAHANSAMVVTAGPSATELKIPMLQPLGVHNDGTQALQNQTPPQEVMHTPPPNFMPLGHNPITTQPYESEGGLPAQLPPLNARGAFPDPWSPEYAHAFPWSVRLAALANTLDDLEPLLDVQNNTYV